MSKKPSTIRIGRRYRANRLAPAYDMLVVGSGIGGLTTAACLAKMGKKVCVLEQHYTAGGFTHSYDRNGYEWDVGVHYIGDMGSPHTMGRRLFDYITGSELHWAPMDDHFDRIFLGQEHFDLVAGKEAYREALISAFPGEQEAIDTYLSYMRSVKAGVRLLALRKILPGWLDRLVGARQARKVPPYFNATTREVLESLTSNQKLIAVLTGQWGDNGLPPAQSSFIIHSMIAQHYMHGGYYPVGGASRMAETIIPVIQQAGGEVFTYASVEEILAGPGGVTGVRMADGTEIQAPVVISDAGVFNTFERLLSEGVAGRAAYLEGCAMCAFQCPACACISACSTRPKSWACQRPTCGYTPVNITRRKLRLSKPILRRSFRWFMFPSPRPRTPVSANDIRGGRPSRSLLPGPIPGLNAGPINPGASAEKTTRR